MNERRGRPKKNKSRYPDRPPSLRERFLIPQAVWEERVHARERANALKERVEHLHEKAAKKGRSFEEWELRFASVKAMNLAERTARKKTCMVEGGKLIVEEQSLVHTLTRIAQHARITSKAFQDAFRDLLYVRGIAYQLAQYQIMIEFLENVRLHPSFNRKARISTIKQMKEAWKMERMYLGACQNQLASARIAHKLYPTFKNRTATPELHTEE